MCSGCSSIRDRTSTAARHGRRSACARRRCLQLPEHAAYRPLRLRPCATPSRNFAPARRRASRSRSSGAPANARCWMRSAGPCTASSSRAGCRLTAWWCSRRAVTRTSAVWRTQTFGNLRLVPTPRLPGRARFSSRRYRGSRDWRPTPSSCASRRQGIRTRRAAPVRGGVKGEARARGGGVRAARE